MPNALEVRNLSKLYRIGAQRRGYTTLRESLTEVCAAPWRRIKSAWTRSGTEPGEGRLQGTSFWALRDVGFEVPQGQVVGVVGRNGAGKSTLLKILSRITEPTQGRAELRGRVGSLLEVGSGFHPELSGRENIYMNGSILGMTRREINRRFDEIVAFAENESFLDTPVKHYSSGMYVRLAFAVAAHLESEIFIVDEVLAVGDAEFQQKCTRKMRDVSQDGRTVLFVSHNSDAIAALCDRVLVMADGQLKIDAPAAEGLKAYQAALEETAALPLHERRDRGGNGGMRFVDIAIDSIDADVVTTGRSCRFRVSLERTPAAAAGASRPVDVAVILRDADRRRLTTLSTHFIGASQPLAAGRTSLDFEIPRLPLLGGKYHVDLWCGIGAVEEDVIGDAAVFEVRNAIYYSEATDLRLPRQDWHGPLLLDFSVSPAAERNVTYAAK
jgi:lipopolysaccharide transport system ATP-binding protein